MEDYSDSDTSSKSECDLDEDPTIETNLEDVDLHEEMEPKQSESYHNNYKTFWTPED